MKNRLYLSLAALLGCLPACSDNSEQACYSPTSNLSLAEQPGAVGCACNPAVDRDVCVQGKGLMCTSGHWDAVIDGPCMPPPSTDAATDQNPADTSAADAETGALCYSPTSDLTSAYQPGAVGCACNPAVDQDVCVQGIGLMCMNGRWQAVNDGPCMPLPPRDAAIDQADTSAADVPIDSRVGTDVAPDSSPVDVGERCGTTTCQPGELCVPGCMGICYCPPAPDGGTCPNGPCRCGALVGCNYVPPSYCSSTLPMGCTRTDGGTIQCVCA